MNDNLVRFGPTRLNDVSNRPFILGDDQQGGRVNKRDARMTRWARPARVGANGSFDDSDGLTIVGWNDLKKLTEPGSTGVNVPNSGQPWLRSMAFTVHVPSSVCLCESRGSVRSTHPCKPMSTSITTSFSRVGPGNVSPPSCLSVRRRDEQLTGNSKKRTISFESSGPAGTRLFTPLSENQRHPCKTTRGVGRPINQVQPGGSSCHDLCAFASLRLCVKLIWLPVSARHLV